MESVWAAQPFGSSIVCVDASVCVGAGQVESDAIFILYGCVCVLENECERCPSRTQKPQYPSTAAAVPSPSHVGVLCRCSK